MYNEDVYQFFLTFPCKQFKACVCYFLSNFYFSSNDSPSKTMKNVFYFIWKALFVLEIFKFLYFPSFFPVNHCFRGWSKKNLKIYDTINCLNENSITHFVWYFELAPDPFLILLNNSKQPFHARNSFKNKVFWKKIIKKL